MIRRTATLSPKRPTATNGEAPRVSSPGAAEPDRQEALELVLSLMAIPGESGREGAVAQEITRRLLDAGAKREDIRHDDAHRRSVLPGEVGNLIFKLPGTVRAPRRLLMAHLDTVPLCIGSKPKLEGGWVRSADATTGLGADDRAGASVVLSTALVILRHKLPHPPLTFFWPVQEEVGLHGARHARLSMLGKPKLAFNWDGGPAEKLTVGATGAYRMTITIQGRASHAGGAPERGVSAIAIAGIAIAELQRNGWHGLIQKGRHTGTSNIGIIRGGAATNVVTPSVEVRAEARSHDPIFRKRIVREIDKAFSRAAREVRSSDHHTGHVKIDTRVDYEAFKLADDEACVLAAEEAVRDVGLEPLRAIGNGGLDANWMTAHGIPTVTMGCGQQFVHTTDERLDVAAFHSACRIALRLATTASS
ncbi:MAG: M20/M25/M40 family metallo-hydrolase [Pirellulales bacterium]|nr:M20/M25/M40 family metallo-hydrolase [Pirellulales bacterium]